MTEVKQIIAGKVNVSGAPAVTADEPHVLTISHQIVEDPTSKERKYLNEDVIERLGRFAMIGGIPLAMLFIMNALTNGGRGSDIHYISELLGLAIALMFTCYFGSLFYQLLPGSYPGEEKPYLFKIETRLSQVDKWAKMRIANSQLLYKHRPIQSISEFSAISGGQANHMIANLGPFAWVSLAMLYASHMQCPDNEEFNLDITDAFIVMGVNGIVMIGLFELNQFDKAMKHGHYAGVFLAIWILVAVMIQGWSLGGVNLVMPIVFNCVAWPCFIVWQWVSSTDQSNQFEKKLVQFMEDNSGEEERKKQLEETRKNVYRHSVKCIVLEGVAIYFTTLALSWYLYQWGGTCKLGCRLH
jgi:hypothetical protein